MTLLDLNVGKVLEGRFRVTELLPAGKSGRGCRAEDLLLGEVVVCKVGLSSDPLTFREFKTQLKTLRGIRSPDVVRPLGYFEHVEGEIRWPLLALEDIAGKHIDEWAEEQDQLEILRAVARVATALVELHKVGVTHGDLNSSNILAADGRFVLIDPEPVLWGPTSECFPGEQYGDRKSLADLAENLLDLTYWPGLSRVLSELRSEGGADIKVLEYAAGALWSCVSWPMLSGDASRDVALLAAGFREQLDETLETLQAVIRARHSAMKELAARICRITEKFRVTANLEIEIAENGDSRCLALDYPGSLARICIKCHSPVNPLHSWVVFIEEARGFTKPWPYGTKSTAGIGQSGIEANRRAQTALLLRVDDSGRYEFLIGNENEDGPRFIPMPEDWIVTNVRMLLGV